MDNTKMGRFISELRKSQMMTQKDLAARLNLTINELLNGEKNNAEIANIETSVAVALQYADNTVKSKTKLIKNIGTFVFSCLLFLGIITCAIVNLAVSGALTWSLISISACVFAWLIFISAIKFGIKGILIALSAFIVPFLLVLSMLVNSGALLLTIGISASIIGIAYLWVVFGVFKILKTRKFIALAIALILAMVGSLGINLLLSRIIYTTLFDVWDALTFAIALVLIILLFTADFVVHKRKASL